MADVLIRSFSKILSLLVGPTNVAIDNWTFQMFYKVTPMLLGACVILVCTRKIVVMWSFLRKIPILFNYWQLLKTVLFQSPQEVSSSIWFLRNKRKAFFGNEMNNWYLNDKFTRGQQQCAAVQVQAVFIVITRKHSYLLLSSSQV